MPGTGKRIFSRFVNREIKKMVVLKIIEKIN